MAYVSGDYIGISENAYEFLSDYDSFADWKDNFSLLSAGNGKMYVFNADETGDDMDFLEFLEDFEDIELEYFSYNLSTNSLSGF